MNLKQTTRRHRPGLTATIVALLAASILPASATVRLLVGTQSNGTIQEYHPTTGAYLGTFGTGLSSSTDVGMIPDKNGTGILVSNGGQVRHYLLDGTDLGSFVSGTLPSYAVGLDIGPDGNLYVADYNAKDIKRYNGTTGAYIDTFATGLTGPEEIAFGPNGDLYLADYSANLVRRLDGILGTQTSSWSVSGPVGLDFDTGGTLYVLDRGSGVVYKYDTTGTSLGSFATGWSGGNGYDLVVGLDGNIYASRAYSDNEVWAYTPAGVNLFGAGNPFITQGGEGSNPVSVLFIEQLVPEPATFGLLLVGGLLVWGRIRRA